MALSLDQPAGRLRLGQDMANRGDLIAALKEMEIAQKWDEFSPGIHATHAQVLTALGRPAEAGTKYRRAAELASEDYVLAMNAALSFAEAGNLADAESAFRLAVKRNPAFDRAWYNLGLLLAQSGRHSEAVEALRHAMNLAPAEADYSYALATVLLQAGDQEGARAAAQRVLNLAPNHSGARQILQNLR